MTSSRESPTNHRSYGGESPKTRAARRRKQFIEAGTVLFGTIGYRKTTMRGLCKQAGLTDRYFYESFSTIEDLLVAVYEQLIDQMHDALLGAIQDLLPSADIDQIIHVSLDSFFRQVEKPIPSRIIWLEVLGVSPRVDAVYNNGLRRFATFFRGITTSNVPEWEVSATLTQVISIGAVGAISEIAKDWLLTEYEESRENLVAGASLILQGVSRIGTLPIMPNSH